jgi:hypothetical protein
LPIMDGCERIGEIKDGIVVPMKGTARRYNPQAPTLAELDIMKEKAEAMGFRRHANVQRMYKIPDKKRPLLDSDVREDRHP